ncbi:hypothetical protein [Xylella fastidiosa]|uniref:hypothetical protein n=2 Tax=Xylella fastidiosa TaxID=2371 RepID=UPI00021442F3|nr:hypothetical protein [Xylella fastidiosa]EGO82397.1 hypothetical protein XFEB_00729 [Xylella fastidiosa EB92.1]MDS9990552.1 hypothetical protein [Xylella fastidiosa]
MLLGMDANNAELHTMRWELLWGVQKSQRYHSCRMAFFDRCDKLNSVIGLLSGSAVIASLGQYAPQWMAIAGAVTVTIATSINLVAGTAQMARIHSDLRRRFSQLESDIVKHPHATQEQVSAWTAQRLEIESDEPPIFVALDILCENQVTRSYAHLKDHPSRKLPWFKRVTAQWLTWGNA